MSSSKATCTLHPMPTWLIKRCSDVLTPVTTQLLNLSLLEGHLSAPWKNAVVKPMLKKSGIDPIFRNYRPVSNLPFAYFVSKIAEKGVIDQLMEYCTNDLLPDKQSSYRKHHASVYCTLLPDKPSLATKNVAYRKLKSVDLLFLVVQ
ncbi:uncharacterized protein [Montipora capricornis]|uniref:uncharacterized protein n=1 Tax=Montipora capricornis TaxID=246305 RepID=UPI0035F1EB62